MRAQLSEEDPDSGKTEWEDCLAGLKERSTGRLRDLEFIIGTDGMRSA